MVRNETRQKLENLLSNYFDKKYCTLVGSGTTSLFLTLKALNLPRGSEIIVPNLTCLVVPMSVNFYNYKPVFVDINSDDYNICFDSLKEKISDKTKAVIAVHSFGHSLDSINLKKLCNSKGIILIEDFCQSFGGSFEGIPHGSFGDVSITSFAIGKTMETKGGGAIFTDDSNLNKRIKIEASKLSPLNWNSISNKLLYDKYKNPPNKLTSLVINLFSKPLTKKINILNWAKYIFSFFFLIDKNIFLHSISVSQYRVLISNLSQINRIKKVTLSQAQLYRKKIPANLFNHPNVNFSEGIFWKYSIIPKIGRRKLFKIIEKQGYKVHADLNIGSSYFPPFNKCWYSKESFPVSENVSLNIINLPVGNATSRTEIDKICKILNNAAKST